MAMSKDGRYGISTNHYYRVEGSRLDMLSYPKDDPLTNKDLNDELLKHVENII